MSNFFLNIFDFFQHRKTLLWTVLLAVTVLLCFSISHISFVEDISSFFPNNADNKRLNDAFRKIGASNKIVVTFSQKDTIQDIDEDLLINAATRFVELLEVNDTAGHIKEVICEINAEQINKVTDFITQNLPYFLEEEDYRRIDSLIQPSVIEARLMHNKELILSPMGGFLRNVILNDPLYFSQNVLKNLEVFSQNNQYNTNNGFIFNTIGECIVTITSNYPISETANNKQLVGIIHSASNQVIAEFNKEVEIVPFGAMLISISNAEQIRKDSIFAVSIAFVLILALLFYFFRSAKSLFFIAIAVGFGALFSLGLIVVFKSTVSIIAIGISSIIFGIAINYPLHFLAHIQHNPNIKQTIREVVNPLLIGNITTVGAFLSLLFISSDAMRDLGLFSSFLLIGTIIFVLIFLPHLLQKNGNKLNCQPHNDKLAFERLAAFSPERNKYIVLIFIIFTVVLFVFSFGTEFETNLQTINYMTREQRAEMDKLMAENKDLAYSIYVVADGATMNEALEKYELNVLSKISYETPLDSVSSWRFSGIGSFVPSKRKQKKVARWNDFWENRKDTFLTNFNKISIQQGYVQGAFDNFVKTLNADFQVQNPDYFYNNLYHLVDNYVSQVDDRTYIYTVISMPSYNSAMKEKLSSSNSDLLIFDNASIGERMVNALSDDFNKVLYICGFIVFIFLFFSFGRIELAILAFIPLTIGWIWILGLMNIFDLKFNIVNIILATFIFGQGDDYTIFVTEGLIYEHTRRKKMLAAFKNSIILSAAILFIGIGTLIFAKHPAMRSLAELSIVGMISVVMCAYLFPPLIFRWLTLRKNKQRLMPVTLVNLVVSIYAFAAFLVGTTIITAIGFFLFTLSRSTDKKKLSYHKLIWRIVRFVVTHIPRVKTTYNDLDNGLFDKPALIICNHQSHIDLMCIMSLTPKLIILTNDWVWNSPFYGRLIKYADFFPVSNGIENATSKLKAMVEKGYSIMVFPEGMRSDDCAIQRFHRGAFHLAEQLKLDILPVLLHGVGHLLPKKEFMLRKGKIHIKVMPRMDYKAMGETLAERAKNMRKLYKKEYEKLADDVETPDYYSDLVIHNYIYKGALVERTVRRNLKKYCNYTEVISQLKNHRRVLIVNCEYGELPLLLSLARKNIEVVAVDNDSDKLDLAANCSSIPSNLHYLPLAAPEEINKYDAVVLVKPTKKQIEEVSGHASLHIIN